jgi:hypothetical protein
VANAAPSSFQTVLGSQLTKPRRPAEPSWAAAVSRIAVHWVMSAVIYAIPILVEELAGLTPPDAVSTAITVAVVWLGIVMPALTLIRTFRAKSAFPDALEEWQSAQERWHRLYYCTRDDVCFVEGENECRPPEDVKGLIYGAVANSGQSTVDLARMPL